MKLIAYVLLVIGLFTFSGCNSTTKDIQVEAHTAEKVNLDGYKRYGWLAAANIIIDDNAQYKGRNFSVNAFIQSKISKELLTANKIEDDSNPDFYVSYVVGVNMDALKAKVDDKGKEYLENIPKTALAVLLIDANTQEIIWAASAEAQTKKEHTDKESQERISFAIEKMFKNF